MRINQRCTIARRHALQPLEVRAIERYHTSTSHNSSSAWPWYLEKSGTIVVNWTSSDKSVPKSSKNNETKDGDGHTPSGAWCFHCNVDETTYRPSPSAYPPFPMGAITQLNLPSQAQHPLTPDRISNGQQLLDRKSPAVARQEETTAQVGRFHTNKHGTPNARGGQAQKRRVLKAPVDF